MEEVKSFIHSLVLLILSLSFIYLYTMVDGTMSGNIKYVITNTYKRVEKYVAPVYHLNCLGLHFDILIT